MEAPLWLRRRASPTEPEPTKPTAAQETRKKEKADKHTPAVDDPRTEVLLQQKNTMEAPLWLRRRALPTEPEATAPTAAQETRRKEKADKHTPAVNDPRNEVLRLKNTMEAPLWLPRQASPTEPEPKAPSASQETRRKEKDDKHTPVVDDARTRESS
ncbi:hypothetical protein L1987_21196 [Smallanthus sonchifolius]|uniref:Uncharacterized protein n=1 Tax=Smallanthus sonchifolius TaxID=185202 RepID=A0ACB9IUE7_9ASTR|nr:hypothetical protein L1987_21196 [Smallanthus sonchifolius]